MAEITADAYQSIKDFANSSVTNPSSWDYIELYDDSQTAVTRISITGDSRFSWTDVDGDAILNVEGTVTGGDSDITTPVTLEYSAIWDSDSNGNQITPMEQFAQAIINQSGDEVVVTHTIEMPDQA